MKKIFQSAAIILATCFIAGKAGAQTVSEQPSQAASIVAQAKKVVAPKETTVPESKVAANPAAIPSNNIEAKPAAVIPEPKKTAPASTQGVEATRTKTEN